MVLIHYWRANKDFLSLYTLVLVILLHLIYTFPLPNCFFSFPLHLFHTCPYERIPSTWRDKGHWLQPARCFTSTSLFSKYWYYHKDKNNHTLCSVSHQYLFFLFLIIIMQQKVQRYCITSINSIEKSSKLILSMWYSTVYFQNLSCHKNQQEHGKW